MALIISLSGCNQIQNLTSTWGSWAIMLMMRKISATASSSRTTTSVGIPWTGESPTQCDGFSMGDQESTGGCPLAGDHPRLQGGVRRRGTAVALDERRTADMARRTVEADGGDHPPAAKRTQGGGRKTALTRRPRMTRPKRIRRTRRTNQQARNRTVRRRNTRSQKWRL